MKEGVNDILIYNCDYSWQTISTLIEKGLEEFNLKPRGNVFVKPNAVFVHKHNIFGDCSFTHPQVLKGTLNALTGRQDVKHIRIGEKSAIGLPTRLAYRYAGYYDIVKSLNKNDRRKVDLYCIDEDKRKEIFVGGKVHSTVRLSKKMTESDFKIYLPKLKRHCVSNMTGALKLNIGILSDDDRSIRHDFLLNEKIVDLLSVGYPDFIVMDAITVGAGNEAVPTPRKLGVLIMGVNPVAVDLISAYIMGYSPEDIEYLKLAIERGYRPSSPQEIRIRGDYKSLEDLNVLIDRLKPYDDDWYRWDDVQREFKRIGTNMRLYFGPSSHYAQGKPVYCHYGCIMGVKMAFASLERYAGDEALKKARGISLIIGNNNNQIDCNNEVAMLIGSCAKANISNARKIVRLDKCFTTATDMIPLIGYYARIPTPYTDFKMLPGFILSFLRASLKKFLAGRYLQDIWYFITKNLIRKV